jgi:hypothetical protein
VHHPHTAREPFARNRPVHVTVRVRAGLPSLRGRALARAVSDALEAGYESPGFQLLHFGLQPKHWHLIAKATGPEALAAAVKGLNVRIARVINRQLGLTGSVVDDRYLLEGLRTPAQLKAAMQFVQGGAG